MRRIFFVLFFVALVLLFVVPAFGASTIDPTIYVDNVTAEDYDEDENLITPLHRDTLEDALSAAVDYVDEGFADVTIILAKPITLEGAITLSDYSDLASITITQSGTRVITAADEARHFIIDSSTPTLTLNGITLAGSDAGGGIFMNTGKLNCTSVTFRNNAATDDEDDIEEMNGGALNVTGGEVNLTSCTFSANTADANGGAISILGGTITLNAGTFNRQNTAGTNGGAIYITAGEIEISGTNTFENSNASENGGAIFVSGTGTITNDSSTCTFTSNFAGWDAEAEDTEIEDIDTGFGGAVCMTGTETLTFGTATFENNRGQLGGAVYVSSGTINFTAQASFGSSAGNMAYYGGAIYASDGSINFTSTSSATDFYANKAYDDGGAIYITGDNTSMSFGYHASFRNNIANNDAGELGDGGAIWWGASVSSLPSTLPSSTVFSGNSTHGSSGSAANGGAIYISGSGTLTLDAGHSYTFSDNTARNNGGAIYAGNANVVITSYDISDTNTASYGGGGFLYADSGTITVTASSINAQKASQGGAVYGTNITVSGSSFSENSAGDDGGAIFCHDGLLSVSDTTFSENDAESNGGAIKSEASDVSITNALFNSNTAHGTDGGAGIYISGQNTRTPVITQSTFRNNRSYTGDAGALLIDGGNADVSLCHFVGNYASNNGGALSFAQVGGDTSLGILSLKSSMFTSNQSEGSTGGGVYVRANQLTIDSCTFDQNQIFSGTDNARGGGLYIETLESLQNEPATIQNCTFTGNQASSASGQGFGGGLALNGNARVWSCTVALENTASTYGGGIYYENGRLTILTSIVVGNISTSLGNDDIYAGSSSSKTSQGYNRMGFYSTNGTHSDFRGLETDSEGGNTKNWTSATFFGVNAALARNRVTDSVPPRIGSDLDTSESEVYLLTLMLSEDITLLEADRATNIIPHNLSIRVPQYDERGVVRWGTVDMDIGAVKFDGTVNGNPEDPITSYTIESITMSGIPNSLRSIGQTASLIALIRYTNGRTSYGGNGSGNEPVTWSSSNQNIVRIDQNGNITALATTPNNSYVIISVSTNRNGSSGSPATDSRPVRVLAQYSYLNISTVYQNYLSSYIQELAEHDIALSLADVSASSVSSSSFQRLFKSVWDADKATQITDLTTSTPTFTTLTSYAVSGYKASKNAGVNVNFQNRSNGDIFPLVYTWKFSGSELKAITGYDLSDRVLNAALAEELFKTLRIDFQGTSKVFQVVGGAGVSARDAYTNQALTLTKTDGNAGVSIELTAYLANVNTTGTNDGVQLMGTGSRKLLIVPDGTNDGAISGSMWLVQKTSSTDNPNENTNPNPNPNENTNPSPNPNPNQNQTDSKSGGGGGGGCMAFNLGLLAIAILAFKRR